MIAFEVGVVHGFTADRGQAESARIERTHRRNFDIEDLVGTR